MGFLDLFNKLRSNPSNENSVNDFLKIASQEASQKPSQKPSVNASQASQGTSNQLLLAFDKSNQDNARLRFNGFVCEKTKQDIVVKSNDNKALGTISNGRFLALPGVSNALQVSIGRAMAEPMKAAVAYGRETGNCSICGRFLNNKESLARGIGPICAKKFGFI